MRDTVKEYWLLEQGTDWRYEEEIALDAIHVDEGAKQNIRLGMMHKDLVKDYTLHLENKGEFPAIILFQPDSNGAYALVDGLHRLAAYKEANKVVTDAYVVEVKDQSVINRLRRSVNVTNGRNLSKEERILHAMFLIEHDRLTQADAARAMGLGVKTLSNELRATTAMARAKQLGIKVNYEAITTTDWMTVNMVSRDQHFSAVVQLMHDARLPGAAVRLLVGEIKAAGSDNDIEEVIKRWILEHKEVIGVTSKGKIKAGHSPVRNLPALFRKAESLMGGDRQALRPEELKLIAIKCREMARSLVDFAAQLESL